MAATRRDRHRIGARVTSDNNEGKRSSGFILVFGIFFVATRSVFLSRLTRTKNSRQEKRELVAVIATTLVIMAPPPSLVKQISM